LDTGVLYCDENLTRLASFPAESVDLIYLDPPFFSNKVYEVIWGDEAEVRSFEDRWEGGIQHYIGWMRERVELMNRVLKSTGSLYLHCDPHASHHLKVMLDEVFGSSNFRNEIIWRRTGAHTTPRRFETVHDVIFFYSKSSSYTFSPVKRPYTLAHVESRYVKDKEGRYKFITGGNILTGPGATQGDSGQPWRGFDPGARHRHWAIPGYLAEQMPPEFAILPTTEKLERLYEAGLIEIKSGAKWPHPVKFLAEDDGTFVSDIWAYQPGTEGVLYATDHGIDADVQWLGPTTAERLGYPTQKPEGLMDRIIRASSSKGDVILDPFCGCGTTVAVADRLGREWVGIDISPTAMEIMRRRLLKQGCVPRILGTPSTSDDLKRLKPFEFQNWIINAVNGTHSPKRVGDMGIDGYWFFTQDPVQVKQSESVGRNVVDNFETAMRRAERDTGYIVAFSFTKGAAEAAARAERREGLNIRLLRVSEVLMLARRPSEKFGPQPADIVDLPLPPKRKPKDMPSAEELVESDTTAATG
jgi:DNA modification methylase